MMIRKVQPQESLLIANLMMRIFAAVVSFAFFPSALSAQNYMRPFTTEVSASLGGAFDFGGASAYVGICQTGTTNCGRQASPGKSVLPSVTGNVAIAMNRYLWFYGQYSYVFPERRVASVAFRQDTGVNTVNRHHWIASGGIELSFPTVHGIVPVLRIGGGQLHDNYGNYTVYSFGGRSANDRFSSENIPVGTFGGGFRWYLRERQGLRVMVNGYILSRGVTTFVPPSSALGQGIARITRRSGGDVTVGYFFQFGGRSNQRSTN